MIGDLEDNISRFKVIINAERCKACYLCVDVCEENSIRKSEESNSTGYFPAEYITGKECIGCKRCAVICPDACIEIYKIIKNITKDRPQDP
jgi:2-oxoglutarate ferredoxin oxidoreductase subunit delta